MSQENVEIVRAVYERFSEGDFRASADVLDPHVVLVLGPEFAPSLIASPDEGAFYGIEAVKLAVPWPTCHECSETICRQSRAPRAAVSRCSNAYGHSRVRPRLCPAGRPALNWPSTPGAPPIPAQNGSV